MSEELKPCPFCGYQSIDDEAICIGHNPADEDDCPEDERGEPVFTGICCPSCAVWLHKPTEHAGVEEGVEVWNARSGEAVLTNALAAKDAEIEKLKVALTEKRRDRIGDAELGGSYLCRAEKAEAEIAAFGQDVVDLVIAAREFWDANNDLSEESKALDKALEPFASKVLYANEPEAALKGDAP